MKVEEKMSHNWENHWSSMQKRYFKHQIKEKKSQKIKLSGCSTAKMPDIQDKKVH